GAGLSPSEPAVRGSEPSGRPGRRDPRAREAPREASSREASSVHALRPASLAASAKKAPVASPRSDANDAISARMSGGSARGRRADKVALTKTGESGDRG